MYLIPVLSFLVLLAFLVSLLLPEMGKEVPKRHSTRSDGSQHVKPFRFVCKCASVLIVTPVMALFGLAKY